MRYQFLRLRREWQRDFMFRSLENIGAVELGFYEVIYEGEVEDTGKDSVALEQLFGVFNVDHPRDFHHASMSVSDLVLLDRTRLWFCDSVGWVELKGENAARGQLRLSIEAAR